VIPKEYLDTYYENKDVLSLLGSLYRGVPAAASVDFFKGLLVKYSQTYDIHENIGFYSAPGRTEIGGNHTDHQGGCVVTASVDRDVKGCASPNGTNMINLYSDGYGSFSASLDSLLPHESGYGKTDALIRGVAKGFIKEGYDIGGFDAYISSGVLAGSGLSSSAAFEVWLGVALNDMFCNNEMDIAEIAKIGRYAENVFYGKPCGLQDQMASAVGGIIFIDFKSMDEPVVKQLDSGIEGHSLCIIDSGGDHSNLTGEYAGIFKEMSDISVFFGKGKLSEVAKADFIGNFAKLRENCGDRAVLRAFHFFAENERAKLEARALENKEYGDFFELVNASGMSSYMYLQNIYPSGAAEHQAVAVALAVCDELLGKKGAFRVHGGGFGGTVQAFVPYGMLERFKSGCDEMLGEGRCHVMDIRGRGGAVII
jgi:galactokinase